MLWLYVVLVHNCIFFLKGVSYFTSLEIINEPYIELKFWDVGQGDAAYIGFPNGEDMIVDCGIDASVLERIGEDFFYFKRSIDHLMISHPDLDHYGGCLDILKRYSIDRYIWYSGFTKEKDVFWRLFWDYLQNNLDKYLHIQEYKQFLIGDIVITILHPSKNTIKKSDEVNDHSIVFLISYGEIDILFTGDISAEIEKRLVEKYSDLLKRVEILKVAHHGSKTSSSVDFLSVVDPKIGIISVGVQNKFNHPSNIVLDRFKRNNIKILRTDKQKSILIKVYKDHYEVVN